MTIRHKGKRRDRYWKQEGREGGKGFRDKTETGATKRLHEKEERIKKERERLAERRKVEERREKKRREKLT